MRKLTIQAWDDMFGYMPELAVWRDRECLAQGVLARKIQFEIPEDVQKLRFSVGSSESALVDVPGNDAIAIRIHEIDKSVYSRGNQGTSFRDLFLWPVNGANGITEWQGMILLFLLVPIVGTLTILGAVVFRCLSGREISTGKKRNWSNETLVVERLRIET